MQELLEALELLNKELSEKDITLNLDVAGGFSLFLQNLSIDVRHSHDINTISRLDSSVRESVKRIGEQQKIDLRWLNDDILTIYDDLQFAGICLDALRFSPPKRIDYSNIHLNVINIEDFARLKLFSLFSEVFDFFQYNKAFEREQDLKDIKTISQVSNTDLFALLKNTAAHISNKKYLEAAEGLLQEYIKSAMNTVQINDYLQAKLHEANNGSHK